MKVKQRVNIKLYIRSNDVFCGRKFFTIEMILFYILFFFCPASYYLYNYKGVQNTKNKFA